jgi:tRNA(fMet)-specific endonuclease VapC
MGHPVVGHRIASRTTADLAIAIISVEEQLGGWYTRIRRAKRRDEIARAYQFLTDNVVSLLRFRIFSLTESAIDRHAELKRQKLNVGKKDLCISAIALEESAVVVTRNRADFGRVPGLTTEDWSQ